MPRKVRGSKPNKHQSSSEEFSPPTLSPGINMSVRQWDEVLNAGVEETNGGPNNRINFGLGMTAADIERYEALLHQFGSRTDRSLEIAQVSNIADNIFHKLYHDSHCICYSYDYL